MILNSPYISGSLTVTGNTTIQGQLTVTGSLSGTASLASNSLLLEGTGSTGFATTASLLAVSSSQQQISASLLSLTASYNALSSSYTALSASYNVASSSFSTRITSDSSSFSSRTTQIENVYATTGSNSFTGVQNFSNTCTPNSFTAGASLYTAGGLRVTQDAYFSSSVYIKGNVTVYGTQSVAYISSSQLDIGTNIITVNTATPSIRYGGLSVFDSGSTGLTGSILWDSELNRWIYSNASGSGGGATYGGGMFISGPRNSQGIGCEQGTTACMLLVGQGGDHLTSSLIYHDSTVTCVPNAIVGGSTISGTTIYGSTAVCSPVGLFSGCVGIGTASPLNLLHVSQPSANTVFRLGNNSAYDQFIYFNGNSDWSIGMDYSNSNAFVISNNSSLGTNDRVVLTTSGNLGLGVTPSNAYADSRTFEIGAGGILWTEQSPSVYNSMSIGSNFYYNAAGDLKYKNSGVAASRFTQYQGSHIWYTAGVAPSAGAAITFTQAMTLDASGRLGIGTATPGGVLDAGCSVFDATTIFRRKSQTGDAGWTALRLVSEKTTAAGGGFGTAISFLITDSVNTNCSLADLVVERDGSNFCGAYSFRTYAGSGTGVERMRITSAGSVGIGASSPAAKLHTCTAYGGSNTQAIFGNSNYSINSLVYDTVIIQADDVTTLKLVERNSGGVDQVLTMTVGDNSSRISTTCANPLQFFVAGNPSACGYNGLSGTAALTITCAGNVGIDATTLYAKLHMGTSSNTESNIFFTRNTTTANVIMGGLRSSLGPYWGDATSTSLAEINLETDNPYYRGAISFRTNNSDATANRAVERMRISSAGVVTITNASSDAQLSLCAGGSTAYIRFLNSAGDTWGLGNSFSAANTDFQLYNFTTSAYGFRVSRGGIYANTTATAANVQIDSNGYFARSTSSSKYKNSITNYDKGLDILNQLRPVYYKGNNDGDTIFAGLIAEEVHDLGLTEFVQYAEDGTPDALAYGNMVSLLVKGMQEQQCTICSQATMINVLKTCLAIA